MTEIQTVTSQDRSIAARWWLPPGTPKGVIQVLHGLAEHIDRYDRFAAACNERGFAVVGHNHRGHGEDATTLGHFADANGWTRVVDDADAVHKAVRARFADRPVTVLGHSMGSYIAQSFVMRRQPNIVALILSGSTWPNRGQVRLAHWLARLIIAFGRPTKPGGLFDKLSFGEFNKAFTPNRTDFDWLSRDNGEVDRYMADHLCGAPSSVGLWRDLSGGLLEISDLRRLAQIANDLPILILGGELDPVGGARALPKLAAAYSDSGHGNVQLTLYPEGRHEMFNEINRDDVTADVLTWIERVTGNPDVV